MEMELKKQEFIYTYASSPEERSLCHLEMRSFFGMDSPRNIIKSTIEIDPSRSPFIRERIEVLYDGDALEDILEQVEEIDMLDKTFKIIFIKINDLAEGEQIEYKERRIMERDLGARIHGEADVHNPAHIFGIVAYGGRWYFGNYRKNEAVWLRHTKKPREYSTALSTRVARAVSNIAVPHPEGIKAIDPCCGIGTVLVEALSMGIEIEGRDINPLVTQGSRENIAHFNLTGNVTLGPIAEITEKYDVAIIDMPYNLYTHATPEEQYDILKHARRIADKLVVVTIETIDEMVEKAGFEIKDRCVTKKGYFSREILVCD